MKRMRRHRLPGLVRRSKHPLAILCLAIILPFAFSPLPCHAQGVITTVAGGSWVFRGDGDPATDAPLGQIRGVASDAAGNVFASDLGNGLVVKISPGGVLSVVAGNGIVGFSGDGGPAANASLRGPEGVAVDADGNVYIADSLNHRIRKVDSEGSITTAAGTGAQGFSGDGGPASNAQLSFPRGVAVDGAGNLYVAENDNHRVRKISPDGTITTIAGNGARDFSGDGGPAISASLSEPRGVAVDGAGNLFIADSLNDRIRKVRADGTITTIAGNGSRGFSGDGGLATNAQLNIPTGVAVDLAGSLYIADSANSRIRKVSPDGTITTVAGGGSGLGDDGPATAGSLNVPWAVAVDALGNLFIADNSNYRVRKVDATGTITTLAGNGSFRFSGDGGSASSASLFFPSGVAVDPAGNLCVADNSNHRIRKVSTDGTISTVAGTGAALFAGDGGPATSAAFRFPSNVAVDAVGNLYVADTNNHRIRKVDPSGIITTVAGGGSPTFPDIGDGEPATSAGLSIPSGVAVDAMGSLYIADTLNHRIRKVNSTGIITTVAGNGMEGFSGDGAAATSASLNFPADVAVDAAGNLYIADRRNQRVRKVSADGIISTVAGSGPTGSGAGGFSGDGGPATSAALNSPAAVAADGIGNLYVADSNHRIRKVSSTGIITTVAGNGVSGFFGDGGPATSASLSSPTGVVMDGAGNLYIADQRNDRIRKVLATVPSFAVSPASLSFSAPAGAPVVAPQQITVASDVAGLGWSAQVFTESGGAWLSVSPTAGSAPGVIAVSVNVMNLLPGTYQGRVTVEAPLAAMPVQTVIVELTVEQALAPKLVVEPVGLTFEIPAGAGNPPAQTLRISNGGSGTVEWTARAETTVGGNWLELSPSSGSASGASPATVQVSAIVGALPPGVYPGAVQCGESDHEPDRNDSGNAAHCAGEADNPGEPEWAAVHRRGGERCGALAELRHRE